MRSFVFPTVYPQDSTQSPENSQVNNLACSFLRKFGMGGGGGEGMGND